MFFQLVPVIDDKTREIVLIDIFRVMDEYTGRDTWDWCGSRRTQEQCKLYVRQQKT